MPTDEQLRKFYQVVRQFVLLSSYVAFVELGDNGNLYIHLGRYNQSGRTVITINPDGELEENGEPN